MKNKAFYLAALLVLCLFPADGSWLSDRTGINIDLNRQVGTGLASMGAPVAEKFEESGNRLIDKMSKSLDDKLKSVDQIATQHEDRLQGIVKLSIIEVDDVIRKEIDHADEVLETRLGNADVIAAKAELGFEEVVRHLLLLGCVLVFLTVVALRLSQKAKLTDRAWLDCGIAAASLAVVYFVYVLVPHGNVKQLVQVHEDSYYEALSSLDLREAKYHLAQLKILQPGKRDVVGRIKKVELLQDVLSRPAMYQTRSGGFDFQTRLAQAQALLPHDPDLAVLSAFVNWQTGVERLDEYASASICTSALLENKLVKGERDKFFLRPLAVQYVQNYRINPLSEQLINGNLVEDPGFRRATPAEMASVLAENPSGTLSPLNALREVIEFDRSVVTLYSAMVPAYIGMIDSDAKLATVNDDAKKASMKSSRAEFAKKIEAAWKTFDQTIAGSHDTNTQLWSMRVNTIFLKRVAEFDNLPADQRYGEDEHNKFQTALLDKILPPVEPILNGPSKSRQLVDSELKQMRDANVLSESQFEKDMASFFAVADAGTNEAKVSAARNLENSAASMGVFTCGESYSCGDGGNYKSYSDYVEEFLTKKVSNDYKVPDRTKTAMQTEVGKGFRTRSLFTL